MSGESHSAASTVALVARGLGLRCPSCGRTKIFRGPFTMHETCSACGRRFDRGPGYFLGSIYFNYGATALLVVALYFSLYATKAVSPTVLLVLVSLFALVFPLWFFRYARSLWMAFDQRWDPWPNEQERRQLNQEQRGTNRE